MLTMKKPKREPITNDFLQIYVGGRFSSVQINKIVKENIFTGVIKKISLEKGGIVFYRVSDGQEFKIPPSAYRVYRYYNDEQIIFESKNSLRIIKLFRPKLND